MAPTGVTQAVLEHNLDRVSNLGAQHGPHVAQVLILSAAMHGKRVSVYCKSEEVATGLRLTETPCLLPKHSSSEPNTRTGNIHTCACQNARDVKTLVRELQPGLPSGSPLQGPASGLKRLLSAIPGTRSLPPHLRFFSVVNVSSVYST